MNDELLEKCRKLASEIEIRKRHLKMAQSDCGPSYFHQGTLSRLRVSTEIRAIIQTITVAAMEKDLAELEAQYAAL